MGTETSRPKFRLSDLQFFLGPDGSVAGRGGGQVLGGLAGAWARWRGVGGRVEENDH